MDEDSVNATECSGTQCLPHGIIQEKILTVALENTCSGERLFQHPAEGSITSSQSGDAAEKDPIPSSFGCEVKKYHEKYPQKHLFRYLLTHTGERLYQCKICHKKLTQKANLSQHLPLHAGERPHVCKVCHRKFSQMRNLAKHSHFHSECETQQACAKKAPHQHLCADETVHECQMCHKKFRKEIHLSRHLFFHTRGKHHLCKVCHKKFARGTQLSQHFLVHLGLRPHGCETCHKKFRRKMHLSWHLLIHTVQTPGACEICHKKFRKKAGLLRHVFFHTETSPYKCEMYYKKFIQKRCPSKQFETNERACEMLEKKSVFSQNLINTGGDDHKCEKSSQNFVEKAPLLHNLLARPSCSLHVCKICSNRFNEESSLLKHLQTHTRDKLYESEVHKLHEESNPSHYVMNHTQHCCEMHSRGSVDKSDITDHSDFKPHKYTVRSGEKSCLLQQFRSHDGDEQPEYEICFRSLIEKSDLSDYLLTYSGEKPCEETKSFKKCTDKNHFSLTQSLYDHSSTEGHECVVCSKRFMEESCLSEHLLTHAGERPHECEMCSRNSQNLLGHLTGEEHRCELFSKRIAEKNCRFAHHLYKCEIHAERSTKENDISHHLLTLAGEELCKCKICIERFGKKPELSVPNHCNGKPQEVEEFADTFVKKSDITEYLLADMDKRPHACKMCPKRFTQKSALLRHLLTHRGEKSHMCNICSMKFIRKQHLSRHLLTHSGEKSHECKICFKKFGRKEHVLRHLLSHSGEKSHECNICFKKFSRKEHLSRHLFTHTADKLEETLCAPKIYERISPATPPYYMYS